MTTRSTFITAAILAALIASTISASADPVRTFDAWGHRFIAPGARVVDTALDVDRTTTASVGPKRSYASSRASEEKAAAAPVAATRTLNVWGARLDAPAQ